MAGSTYRRIGRYSSRNAASSSGSNRKPDDHARSRHAIRDAVEAGIVSRQLGRDRGLIASPRRERLIDEMRRPLILVVRFEQKQRFGTAIGNESVATPGAAVDRRDRQRTTGGGQCGERRCQQRSSGGSIAGRIVADEAEPIPSTYRRRRPPERAPCSKAIVSVGKNPVNVGTMTNEVVGRERWNARGRVESFEVAWPFDRDQAVCRSVQRVAPRPGMRERLFDRLKRRVVTGAPPP
jgi:hypothetical protein